MADPKLGTVFLGVWIEVGGPKTGAEFWFWFWFGDICDVGLEGEDVLANNGGISGDDGGGRTWGCGELICSNLEKRSSRPPPTPPLFVMDSATSM